jgi:predicted Fe-Mo cluster-binding NifX family protein
MTIVFTAQGPSWSALVEPRFGRAAYLLVYDEAQEKLTVLDNQGTAAEQHGAGPRAAQKLLDSGAEVLVTGNGPGGNAAAVLKAAGVAVYVGADGLSVKEALDAWRVGVLAQA